MRHALELAELRNFRPGWNSRLVGRHEPELSPVTLKYRGLLLKALDAGHIAVDREPGCVCGNGALLPIAATDRFGLPFGSALCARCGLVLTTPRLAEASLPRYYNEIYHPLVFGEENIASYVNFTGYDQGKHIWERLSPHLGERGSIRVLEIGAGTGSVLHEMREAAALEGRALEPWGVEYSRDCMGIAADRFGITLREGGCPEAMALGKDFDCIVLSHVLEHVSDMPAFLAGLNALMHDGTLCYVEVPGLMVLHRSPWYDFDFLKYAIHAHSYAFTSRTLADTMRRSGFVDLAGDELAYGVFRKGAPQPEEAFAAVDLLAYLAFVERELEYLQGKKSLTIKASADQTGPWRANAGGGC